MPINYRCLTADEWPRLTDATREIFGDERGLLIPHPTMGICAVAEDSETGRIVGVWFVQAAFHQEPLGVLEDYRSAVSVHALQDTLHAALLEMFPRGVQVMAVAQDDRIDGIMKGMGFDPIGVLMGRMVEPADAESAPPETVIMSDVK